MSQVFKYAIRLCCVLTAAGLSGCISLFPSSGPAPSLVSLNPEGGASEIASHKSLLVEEATAPILYNGTKIVIQKVGENGLVSFTHANEQEWVDTLPKLLQRAVVENLKSPRWPAVTSEAKAFVADYRLGLDIRKFQIVLPGAVEVSVNLTLIDNKAQKVILTKTLSYRILTDNNVTGYIRGFNEATTHLLKDASAVIVAGIEH
jgi:ABC-type uncharacterized transport system auxiliary subunit